MNNISDLAEMVSDEPELIPEIVAVDARLAIRARVSALSALLDRAHAVIPSKEVVPGTAYARLDAHTGAANHVAYVRVTASDGMQTLTMASDAVSVSVGGTALIPTKRILDVLKLAPEPTVQIVLVGNAAVIRSGRAQWTIQLPVGEPNDLVADTTPRVSVHREAFLGAIEAVRVALPTFSSRPALHQVAIEHGRVTAADGGRVHRMDILDMPQDLICAIPTRGLDQVVRMLRASKSKTFEVGVRPDGVVVAVDNDVLVVQRLTVNFPKVDDMLLAAGIENQSRLTLQPAVLAAVVRRVRLAADPEFGAVAVTVMQDAAQTHKVQVRAKDRLGNAASEILACQWTGPSTGQTVILNARYLLDLLSGLDTEFATFRLGVDTKTVRKPILVEDSETGFVAIVQQMRSDWLS